MSRRISKTLFIIAAVIGVCSIIGVAGAQLYPQMFSFVDVKSNTTRVRLFGNNGPKVHFLNFKGGATINNATSALDIASDWGGPSPTPTPSPPTAGACDPSLRMQHFTIQGLTGVKDLTYQCCKTTADTYIWIAGYCQ